MTVSSSRSSSLDTEGGALTWLTNTGKREASHVRAESLRETNGRGGLTLTQRSGCDTVTESALNSNESLEQNLPGH